MLYRQILGGLRFPPSCASSLPFQPSGLGLPGPLAALALPVAIPSPATQAPPPPKPPPSRPLPCDGFRRSRSHHHPPDGEVRARYRSRAQSPGSIPQRARVGALGLPLYSRPWTMVSAALARARIPLTGDARALARPSPESMVESAARACRPAGCRDDSYRGTGVCEKNVHLFKMCQVLHVCPPPPKFNVGTRQS